MSLKEFEIGKELGKGAFGSVSICKRKADGKMYAMKRVKISQLSTKERENALNEVRILASLSHPNIIGYKEAFFDEDSKTLNIVMEFADDGDIESKIQKSIKSTTKISEDTIWSYLIQIVQGLKYLHDNSIMHRDLKCANIFLIKDGTLKLGDLNVSKIVKMGMVYTQTGTPYYASPEVWGDKPYNYKSDLWSVGCILYELCALRPPFKGTSLENLYKNVIRGVYDPIPSVYSKDLSNLISMLLQVNPSNRPNCDQFLSNEIVLRHMKCIKGGNSDIVEKPQLLCTIKYPKNMNEINARLPKKKKYISDIETIDEDKKNEEVKMGNYDININKGKLLERDVKREKEIQREKEMKELMMQREKEAMKNEQKKNELINKYAVQNNQINLNKDIYNRPVSSKNQNDRPKTPVLVNNNKINNQINMSPINNYNKNIAIANNINKQKAISPRPSSAKNENKIIVYNKPSSPKVGVRDNNVSPLRVGLRKDPSPIMKQIPVNNRPISAVVNQKPSIDKINYIKNPQPQQKLIGKIDPIVRSNPLANNANRVNTPISKNAPVKIENKNGPKIVYIKK